MADIKDVTDATFEAEVLRSPVPVLVDFWATWCAPCKALSPLVHQLADEKGAALKVVKIDIQVNPGVPRTHKVTNIPTLIVFKNGQVVSRKVGAAGGIQALRDLVAHSL